MGQEIVFGVGALVLLTTLIYGILQHRYRNKSAVRVGDEVVADRYRNDET
jgi:hypothetical protein